MSKQCQQQSTSWMLHFSRLGLRIEAQNLLASLAASLRLHLLCALQLAHFPLATASLRKACAD